MESNLKARAFAAYLGSEYVSAGVLWGIVDDNAITHLANSYKLLLKPLSSITDDEVVEVGKILDKTGVDWSGASDCIESTKDTIDAILGLYDGYSSDYDTSELFAGNLDLSEIIDYLRFKSYNLPFAGHDLVKENIAQLKTEK